MRTLSTVCSVMIKSWLFLTFDHNCIFYLSLGYQDSYLSYNMYLCSLDSHLESHLGPKIKFVLNVQLLIMGFILPYHYHIQYHHQPNQAYIHILHYVIHHVWNNLKRVSWLNTLDSLCLMQCRYIVLTFTF